MHQRSAAAVECITAILFFVGRGKGVLSYTGDYCFWGDGVGWEREINFLLTRVLAGLSVPDIAWSRYRVILTFEVVSDFSLEL